MSAIKIVENVWEVGVKDADLKVFDITMETDGTTYNSYLIKGTEKTALIDCVKEEFTDEFLDNLKELTEVEKIDYLIVNHTEPDHSGAMPAVLDINPGIKIFCSAAAVPYVKNIINRDADIEGVKDKTQLDLGGKTLTFRLMP